MTRQRTITIRRIHDADDARRFEAAQASREQAEQVARDAALERAAELFLAGYWSESRRVLELNYLRGN